MKYKIIIFLNCIQILKSINNKNKMTAIMPNLSADMINKIFGYYSDIVDCPWKPTLDKTDKIRCKINLRCSSFYKKIEDVCRQKMANPPKFHWVQNINYHHIKITDAITYTICDNVYKTITYTAFYHNIEEHDCYLLINYGKISTRKYFMYAMLGFDCLYDDYSDMIDVNTIEIDDNGNICYLCD